jgi:hypothetical protein
MFTPPVIPLLGCVGDQCVDPGLQAIAVSALTVAHRFLSERLRVCILNASLAPHTRSNSVMFPLCD